MSPGFVYYRQFFEKGPRSSKKETKTENNFAQ